MMSDLTFGERVKIILVYMKMSQREFAKRTGLNESQLSKLLRGKREPLYYEVISIADTLGIPFECLIGKSSIFDDILRTIDLINSSSIW